MGNCTVGSVRRGAIVLLTMLLVGAPVLLVRAPPMGDLALHEGAIAILRHLGDPAFAPASVYALNLGHGGQLFHLLGAALALVVPPVVAARILVAASLAGVVAASARLAAHLRTARWSCLLAAPLLGWTFASGFAPNLVGLAVLLAVLPAIDRAADAPSPRRAAGVGLAMIGCHLAHDATLLVAVVAVVVLALARRRPGGRSAPWRLAPVVVAVALLALETHLEARAMTPFPARWSKTQWHDLGDKITHVGDFLFGAPSGVAGVVLRVAFVASLLGSAILFGRGALALRGSPRDADADPLRRARFVLLAAVLFALFVVLPYSVNYGGYLYVRFLAPAALVAIVSLAPADEPLGSSAPNGRDAVAGRLLGLFAVVPLFAFVSDSVPAFRRADASERDLDHLFARIVDATPASEAPRVCSPQLFPLRAGDELLLSQPLRILALRGGRVLHSLADYPNAPVVVRPEARWDDALGRLTFAGSSFAPAFDFTRFEWLLVYVPDASSRAVLTAVLPEAELVERAGRWLLFRSRLPLVPIDSPDALPPPGSSTLADRVAQYLRKPESR